MLKKTIICAAAAVCGVIAYSNVRLAQEKEELSELSMDNVEALASGESGDSYLCQMEGSVLCIDGRKYKYVYTR